MSDMAMCVARECPLKERCLRSTESGMDFTHYTSVAAFGWSLEGGCVDFVDARVAPSTVPMGIQVWLGGTS